MKKMTNKEQYPSLSLQDELTDFLLYTAPNSEIKVEVLLNNETIWLTQKRMAELFSIGVPAISKHLKNIFDSGELQQEVVISILENTTEHGAIAGKTQTTATALAEYEKFNKTQKIESDFDKETKAFLKAQTDKGASND